MCHDESLAVERAVFVPDIDRVPPPGEPYDRLYLGSEFCAWRLPGKRELGGAHAFAARRGMTFSLVTPFLGELDLARTLDLVRALPADPSAEVVANDIGLIEALRAAGWKGTVVAGRLLTRQRRGPGFQSFGDIPPEAAEALRGSALDAPGFVELLGAQYGVRRFELDDLVQGTAVPPLPAGVSLSLYRPFLLVTATRICPWVFDGRTWDRSRGCGRPCRGHVIRLVPVEAAGSSRCAPPSCSPQPAERDHEPPRRMGCVAQSSRMGESEGVRSERPPAPGTGAARTPARPLVLGGCAQFLENRSDAPPPPGVDRIVWQPQVPA